MNASTHPSYSTKFIEVQGVEQTFRTAKGLFPALREINLTIAKGEFVALIGHSGCGKSTLLNLIAGLTTPTNGALLCANKEIKGPGPERAVVFQNHSLLPWLTCFDNIYLAVERVFGAKETKAQLKARISADPREAHLALEAWAFHNYKLLQFFDTLALYFHLTHPEARTEASFLNVPQGVNDDVTVTITPRDGAYVVAPWPFAGDELIVSTPGCWMSPLPEGSDIEHAYRYALTGAQIERLVAP